MTGRDADLLVIAVISVGLVVLAGIALSVLWPATLSIYQALRLVP